MLQNAKELRKNYIERVEEVADDIINVIDNLENGNCWEVMLGDDNNIDILFLIEGSPEYDPMVDIVDVYNYLSSLVDNRISETKPVIEALEEIFEINYDPWNFELSLKGYTIEK